MSQSDRIYSLLLDGEPHRTDQIVEKVYGHGLSLARVGARIWDIKKKYPVEVVGWKDPTNPTLYFYQMKRKPRIELPPARVPKVVTQKMF